MAAPRAGDAATGGIATASASGPLLSWLVDACLVILLTAIPLTAPSADRASIMILGGASALGAWSLYQRASRSQRISRCSWTIFLAAATALHMAARALDPATGAVGIMSQAGAAARLAMALALAGKLGGLAWERRRPRLIDVYDWAAILCLAILALIAAAFVAVGEMQGARALEESAAITAMFLVVRGQCGTAGRARRLARLATASMVLALAVWGITR